VLLPWSRGVLAALTISSPRLDSACPATTSKGIVCTHPRHTALSARVFTIGQAAGIVPGAIACLEAPQAARCERGHRACGMKNDMGSGRPGALRRNRPLQQRCEGPCARKGTRPGPASRPASGGPRQPCRAARSRRSRPWTSTPVPPDTACVPGLTAGAAPPASSNKRLHRAQQELALIPAPAPRDGGAPCCGSLLVWSSVVLPRVLEPLRLASLLQTVLNPRGWPERVWTDRFEMPIAPLASEKLQDSAAPGRAAPARARRLLCHGLCNARVCLGSGLPGGLLGGRTRCALCRGFKTRIVLLLACIEATLWYMPCSGVVI